MKKINLIFSMLVLALIFSSCEKTLDPDEETEDNTTTGAIITHSANISANETWKSTSTHVIESTIYVDNATLTIEPGTTIKFKSGTSLYFGYSDPATLLAQGTSTLPIIFTSYAPSPSAGDWDHLYFADQASPNSVMTYCTVKYGGGYNSTGSEIYLYDSKITINNCTITNSEHYGVKLNDEASFVSFVNNSLSNNGNHPISMYANYVHTIGTGNIITGTTSNYGILVNADTYEQADETWLAQTSPYVIDGYIYIEKNSSAKLTIAPGAALAFTDGSGMYVGYSSDSYGTLIAEGTATNPITFTSSAASKSAGDWNHIYFDHGANNCKFNYCKFEYGGGYNSTGAMLNINEAIVTVKNSTFENSLHYAIKLDDEASFNEFSGNTFSYNSDYPVLIYANYVHTIGTGNVYNTNLGILVESDNIDQQGEITWKKQSCAYCLSGSTYLGSTSGTTLNIEAGTNIKFNSDASLYIGYTSGTYGRLIAEGTSTEAITFTSAAPSPSKGNWGQIYFDEGTMTGTIMDYCNISYGGGYNSSAGNLLINNCGANVTISNSDISHSEHYGIHVYSCNPTLTNNTYSNNPDGDVQVD